MAYTTLTTDTKKTYSWTDDPDFIATAVTENDTNLLNLAATSADQSSYGVFLSNPAGADVVVDFVTFLKGVITDLEALITPAP